MKTKFCLLALFLLLVFSLLGNLFVGSMPVPAEQVFRLLAGGTDVDAGGRFVVLESRLPQVLTAACAGAALAMSGLMLQTFLAMPWLILQFWACIPEPVWGWLLSCCGWEAEWP